MYVANIKKSVSPSVTEMGAECVFLPTILNQNRFKHNPALRNICRDKTTTTKDPLAFYLPHSPSVWV